MNWKAATYYCCLLPLVIAQYTPTSRWGQAAAVLEDILYVHGGMSDPYNTYSYTSAPEISDILSLNLSTSFNSASPPWQLLSSDSSPALAWHTLSAFTTQQLLLFGGQPGPNSETVLTTLNDSAALLSVSNRSHPSFLIESQNWAGEPMRRMRHSASYTGGKIWIVGGEKADGSGNAFADHYVFDPSAAEFNPLPSGNNAPPDIYGHASLVLRDGKLMVLGGYCASCADLVPMSTVWSLDTTQSNPNWQVLLVSNSSLPSPRRDFSAVMLSSGNILIHGGGDAQLETTYSDGWILDTGQSPMVWQNIEVLAQVGQRKDHFAIQTGDLVLFGFGYGSSSPASASLMIYDPTSSTMVSSYTAPTSTPASNSLPAATQTSNSGLGSGSDNGGGGQSGSPTSGNPASTGPSDTSNSSSGSSHNSTKAIALGTTFGILGLVAGGLATAYYVKRVRDRNGTTAQRFFLLGGDLEEPLGDDGSGIGVVPAVTTAGKYEGVRGGMARLGTIALPEVLTSFGIRKSRALPPQPRKDMFADEDTRSFSWGTRWNAPHRQGSEAMSVWSLRSMGAVVRGMLSRQPSSSATTGEWDEWERLSRAGDGNQEKLIHRGQGESNFSSSLSSRRAGESFPYTDPFEDPREEEYDSFDLRPGALGKDAEYDRPISRDENLEDYDLPSFLPLDITLPLSVPLRKLGPLEEVSHTSISAPSNSLPSLPESSQECSAKQDHSVNGASEPVSLAITSNTTASLPRSNPFHAPPPASPPRYFSILNSQPPPSQPIRRSDSWWTRFAKTPLLDRRASVTSTKPLDFRDPTPAPPLLAIKETTQTRPRTDFATSPDSQPVPVAQHERSVSSAHSGRTANTEAAERLGERYDVVQSLVSDHTSVSQRTASMSAETTTEQGMLAVTVHHQMEAIGDDERSVSPDSPSADEGDALSYSRNAKAAPSRTGTAVSNRIQAFERKIAQQLDSQRSPSPKNTRQREEIPSRSRPTIQYGLAPHAPLFIANP